MDGLMDKKVSMRSKYVGKEGSAVGVVADKPAAVNSLKFASPRPFGVVIH